jgi:DNA-binding IclR family transcriptional regulator
VAADLPALASGLTHRDGPNYLSTIRTYRPFVMRSATETELPPKRPEDSDLSAVKTLRKALTILDAFASAERSLTVAEVALMTGVTRPTAHRLVQTLVSEGYLSQDPRDGRISPGFSVLQLAGRLLDTNRLRLEALPHLEALARTSGERSNLGILHRGQLLFLAGVEKPTLPTIYSRFGKTAPAYCVSLGKAILAELPDGKLNDYLAGQPLLRRTPNTITEPAALRKELARTKRQGYAVDNEEYMAGVFCIAAPILVDGGPAGAIGITGRSLETLMEHLDAIRHTAEVISHVLSRGA